MCCPDWDIKAMQAHRADAPYGPGFNCPSQAAQGCQGKDFCGTSWFSHPKFMVRRKAHGAVLSAEGARASLFLPCALLRNPGRGSSTGVIVPKALPPQSQSCRQSPFPEASLLSALGHRQCPATVCSWVWHGTCSHMSCHHIINERNVPSHPGIAHWLGINSSSSHQRCL